MCNTLLNDRPMVRDDGKRVCQKCVTITFCDGCFKKLVGTTRAVGDKKYHPDCFKCDKCGDQLEGSFAKVGKQHLCKPCAVQGRSAGVCTRCRQALTSAYMTADLGDKFHKKCFTCVECQTPLSSTAYVVDRKRKHKYQTARYVCKECDAKETCFICSEAVTEGGHMTTEGAIFHRSCFKCVACGKEGVEEREVAAVEGARGVWGREGARRSV
jgi:hypothetical protein